MISQIIKIVVLLGTMYFLNKLGVFRYISNKMDVLTKNTKEYQKIKKERNKFMKKFIKQQKINNEV